MPLGPYAVVWIDHEDSRCIFLENGIPDDAPLGAQNILSHHRARIGAHRERRATDDHVFYQKIANDLAAVRKFLLVGPADAEALFVRHLHRYDARLIVRLNTIEASDRPSDETLLRTGRTYFQ